VRTRIALAAATAVSFMITPFIITTAAASAASSPGGGPATVAGTATSAAGGHLGHSQPASALSINALLWPQVVGAGLPAGTTAAGEAGTPQTQPPAPAAAPAPTPAPAALPPAPPAPTDTSSTDTADWQCIRIHESGDAYNDPTRPSGAYGILESTWESFGYSGWPYQAAPAVQDALALELYHEYGWSPWSTSAVCGLA
jgi:hypothetical protein